SKNVGHIIPLAVDTEDTFRGHIMVSFMAICLYLKLNQCFKGHNQCFKGHNQCFKGHKVFTAKNALMEMRNLKCKDYDDCILVKEPTEDMREISKIVGIDLPEKISLPMHPL
ncbi:MAG: hypothetical protein LBE38_05350, partial [Deltaproteobacteria bacterium]|nr:hypothetical protein [Deltaproteobacteria bacterium]